MIDTRSCFRRQRLTAASIVALVVAVAVRAKADDEADEVASKGPANRPNPHIVVADHVLLWDNRIVTWDQVLLEFRTLRRGGPFHPTFHFTHGINNRKDGESWQIWHNRIMAVYKELFEPAGVSLSNLSPRGSEKFDAIKTADDLRPDPNRARPGKLLTPDGSPAAGAQVVVLPTKAVLGVALQGTQLRDPFDELWTLTDEQGNFTIYPTEEECLIAAIDPSGFVIQRAPPKGDSLTLRLSHWATV